MHARMTLFSIAAAVCLASTSAAQIPDWSVDVHQFGQRVDHIRVTPDGDWQLEISVWDNQTSEPISGAFIKAIPTGPYYACPLDPNFYNGAWHSEEPTDVVGRTTISIKGSGCSDKWFFEESINGFVGIVSAASPDLNQDGAVDTGDFVIFQQAFGSSDPRADFNNDGTVNLPDFVIFETKFLTGC